MLRRRNKYLIVVLVDDLDLATLPDELQTYLRTYTYIDARNYEDDLERIRKRIRFAMPGTPLAKIQRMQHDLPNEDAIPENNDAVHDIAIGNDAENDEHAGTVEEVVWDLADTEDEESDTDESDEMDADVQPLI